LTPVAKTNHNGFRKKQNKNVILDSPE